jgi:MEDS: MEthanogen/methylotroph, DcmR Sensory domain
MVSAAGAEQSFAPHTGSCRLVVRKNRGLGEVLQFVVGGLEIGQQVVAMASPACLKELARGISESGLKPDAMLRNGRLVFLAAPDCLSLLGNSYDPYQRGPLRRNGSMMRWISDWSWAYGNGTHPESIHAYQHDVHEFVRPLTSMCLCTVHCENLERTSLLAILAEHRRAAKGNCSV